MIVLKRNARIAAAVAAMAALAAAAGSDGAGRGEAAVRPAAVAGKFYPAEPGKLRGAIRGFMNDALPSLGERPLAIVVPHAGYVYSGQIAADAYRQTTGGSFDLVVILGTNHTTPGFGGVSVYPDGAFETPLGRCLVDARAAKSLLAGDPSFGTDLDVHSREHSVEVQVPFVQFLFPEARILPIVVGAPDPGLCERLGAALARVVRGRKALIVASSDLAHYPSYDDAVAVDRGTLTAIASMDPSAVRRAVREQEERGVPELSTCACGEAPVLVALSAAKALGAAHARVVSYANSGDCAVGTRERVVGYGAVVLCDGPGEPDSGALEPLAAPPSRTLSPDERRALLALARETISRFLETGMTPQGRGFAGGIECERGAFVTLKKDGRLRGCIGHMAEDAPLSWAVRAMALQAAFNDRRFPPLERDELDHLEIEISALTPARRVGGPADIVLGRDGVILRKEGRSAVFLPQVAVEQGWDRETMLSELSRKAGLPAGAWKSGAEFLTFEAEVFAEAAPR